MQWTWRDKEPQSAKKVMLVHVVFVGEYQGATVTTPVGFSYESNIKYVSVPTKVTHLERLY